MYNPTTLANKRILVTGASSNVGRACAVALAGLGAELVLLGRNEEQLRKTADLLAGGGHQIVGFDLNQTDEIATLPAMTQARERRLSGLVHSAGICPLVPLAATSPAILQQTMRINFDAFVELCRHFSKRTVFSESGGSFVAISSVSAKVGWPAGGAYCASKAALDGLVRVLSLELAPRNIRVNTVCPSDLSTPMQAEAGATAAKSHAERGADQPLGLGDAADIANAVAFLMGDAGRFITGTSLIVDGGFLAKGN
jgi:NAD(P)-dependent dehydrogenase (short-subunit alcohol dehydrogenase family)